MKLKDLASGVSDLLKMDPRILKVDPGFNVRLPGPELDEHLEDLKNSIRANGVQRPLVVRLKDDQAIVVDGHCRHAAVMALIEEGVEIETVPCLPEGRGVSDADRVALMITANSGKPLSPLEKGEVCKRLLGYGWSPAQIAAKVGIGEKQVMNLVDLTGAPAEVKEMISEGSVSATTALKTLKSEGTTQGTETLKKAVETARAAGKEKATAKTIAQTKPKVEAAPPAPAASIPSALGTATPQAPESFDPFGGNVAPSAEPEAVYQPEGRPRVINTPGKWKEALDTLWEITQIDDIKVAQIMVKDFFGINGNSKAA